MSISTAKQFVAVLAKSRLLKPKHLDVVRDAAEKDPDPKALAGRLVKKGLLSHWQARQLLGGHASFFLGEYRLIESLTNHSGSHVYLADHKTLGRRVVLKRLPRAVMDRADRKKQLLGAIRAAAGFDHRNLARVYNIEKAGDRYYVISQYVEGSDLAAIVAKDGPLDFADAAAAISQAAAGLAEAHRRKAVHGGVRPSNLVRSPEGQVKLVSVATARRYESSDESDDGKDTPEVLDAANYQAPELLKSEAEPTPAADIYSLGCTLYFLLTGEPPFAEGSATERATAHARHQPPGILRARPDTPDVLVKACRKMLAKQPEDRPSSANDIVKMLAELVPVQDEAIAETATAADEESNPRTEAKPKTKAAATGTEKDKSDTEAVDDSSAALEADDIAVKTFDELLEDTEEDAKESSEEDRKPSRASKPGERRPPVKAAPAAAKPAARRRAPASEEDEEYKLAPAKKTSSRETPSKKSAAAAGVAADADSPVPKSKPSKTKAEKEPDENEEESSDDKALVAGAASGGFMRKNAKWLLIGGGSIAVLLLAAAVTLPFVLGNSNAAPTDTEVAQAAPSEEDTPKPTGPVEVPEGPVEDLNTGIDINSIDLGLDDEPKDTPKPDDKTESADGGKEEGSTEDPKTEEGSKPAAESGDNPTKTEDPKPNPGTEKPAAETSEKPPEKTPEKPPEKKPEKPPEKKPPQKPPTFRDLPAVAALPPVPASGEAPAEVTLGKIYARERAPWIVVLKGGEAIVPNAELSLNRDAAAAAGGRAYVAMLTPRGGTAAPIARFWHDPKANALKFQWLETAAAATGAAQLRLCELSLDVDGEEKTLAFSKPQPAPPLLFDLDKKMDKVLIEADDLPDDDLLRLEITGIEGVDTKAYPFQAEPQGAVEAKKQVAVALQRMDRDRNAQMIALVKVNFVTARKGLTISRRVEQPQAKVAIPEAQLSLFRQKGEEEFKKVMDQIKKAEGHGAKDKFRPQLDQIEWGLGQIDLLELFNKKVKIHYRIILQSGNHKVPLYDSQMAGGAPAAP